MKQAPALFLFLSMPCLMLGSVAHSSDAELSPAKAFCEQVNADWSMRTPIPPSRPWISEYVESYDIVQRQLELLIAGAVSAPRSASARAIASLYESAIDMQRRDAALLVPLQRDFRELSRLSTPSDIARLIARFNRRHGDQIEGSSYPAPTPFALSVWPDPDDSTHQAVQLNQSGLGLPGRDYYLGSDEKTARVREEYLAHIRRTLAIAGENNAAKAATSVLGIETRLARLQWTAIQTQDHNARRRMTLPELERMSPGFPWRIYFREAGMNQNAPVLLLQPSYISEASELLVRLPVSEVAAYFRWQLLRHYAPYLSSELASAAAQFYQLRLLGFEQRPSTAESAVILVQAYLPEDVSKLYVTNYFSPQSKQAVEQIAENVRRAFIRRIDSSQWLSPLAKAEAQKKIGALEIEIGYPDNVSPLPSIALDSHDLIGNLIKLSERKYRSDMARSRKPVDRSRWWTSPSSITGSYSQTANTLIIAAGRLQPPLFDRSASDAANYGGVGTLIGHEMGHAIDNQGSQYDSYGNLRDWWTPTDHKQFSQRADQLAAWYSRIEAMPGIHVDGQATLSENIADLAGLSAAHDAFLLTGSAPASRSDEKAFFAGWAERWRVKYTDALLLRVLKSDTHAPLQNRCSEPLANFASFYKAIGIDVPAQTISIW